MLYEEFTLHRNR